VRSRGQEVTTQKGEAGKTGSVRFSDMIVIGTGWFVVAPGLTETKTVNQLPIPEKTSEEVVAIQGSLLLLLWD
jgi:hypothetical protein